jgi:hypothetical protein
MHKINNENDMRPHHTVTEFCQNQPLLATPIANAGAGERTRRRPPRVLAHVTFCFAWLFGLEPFLTGASDDESRAGFDRP